MIFLSDNVLLESELKPDHIKPRLLGMSHLIQFPLICPVSLHTRNLTHIHRPLGNMSWPYPSVVSP
jgi:phosphoketolase